MFRRYTIADRSSCIEIVESNTPRYFSLQDCTDFLTFLDSHLGIYSILEDKIGTIVGCGGIDTRKQGEEGILTWGMIHETRHRQGWGSQLTFARLHQLTTISTVQKITLNTSNETFSFYEKLGFHTVSFTPNYYSVGLHRYDMEVIVDETFRSKVQKK